MSDTTLSLGRAVVRRRKSSRPTRATPAPPSALFLLALVALLVLIGLMMVLSASSVIATRENQDSWSYFKRQLLWVTLGSALMFVTANMDYRVWKKHSQWLVALSGALLLIVLVPGFGIRVGGSTRWLDAGPVRIQPSELAKLALLLFSARLLSQRAAAVRDPHRTMRPILLVTGGFIFLVMLQPDMGTTLVGCAIVFAIVFAGGVPLRTIFNLAALGAVAAVILGVLEPYRRARIMSFLDPWAQADGAGYQVVQSIIAMGTGGFSGLGLGASRAKWAYVPNAHTDFIFTIIAEELGLIGAVIVLGLFFALALVGVRTAMRAPDRFGALVAVGITTWLVGQAVINIGAVIGLLPVTGVPLPLVSFGGSALVVTMAATGILLNIARQGKAAPRRVSEP